MQTRFCIAVILMLAVTASSAWAQQDCKTTIAATTGHLVGKIDGTVVDSKTKLMWKRCPEGFNFSSNSCASSGTTTYNWVNALGRPDVANVAKFAGYTDWRLPNIKELQSIVEEQCYGPAVRADVFPAVSSVRYVWSNSPADPLVAGNSYYIDFYYGDILHSSRTDSSYYVRLVRDCGTGECD